MVAFADAENCPDSGCDGELVDIGKTPQFKEAWICDSCGKKFEKKDIENKKGDTKLK